jgi:hypothetical protein
LSVKELLMPRPGISLAMTSALQAQATGEGLLILATLTHSQMQPVRLVRNPVDVTSRGNLFKASAIDIVLAAEEEDTPPSMRFVADLIDRSIMADLRQLEPFIYCMIELVRVSDPDEREQRWINFRLVEASTPDAMSWEARLEQPDFTSARYPLAHFQERLYPGLWNAA